MNKIINTCRNYFHAFQDLGSKSSRTSKSVSVLKILSYFTVVAPLAMGITYGVATLVGRVQKSHIPLEVDSRVKKSVKAIPGTLKEASLQKNPLLKQDLKHHKSALEAKAHQTAEDQTFDILNATQNGELAEAHKACSNPLEKDDEKIYQLANAPLVDQSSTHVDSTACNLSQAIGGTRTRDEWIKEAMESGLRYCSCEGAQLEDRLKMETIILQNALETFPVESNRSLTILSFASGKLLQDYLILQTLVKSGYKEINLDLVDPATSQDQLMALKNLVKDKMLGVSINLHLYSNTKDVPTKTYNFAFGIDVDIITDFSKARSAWLALAHVFSKIHSQGFCYLQSEDYQIIYDLKKTKDCAPLIKTATPFRLGIVSSPIAYTFCSLLFCRLLELKQKGKSQIEIYFFSDLKGKFNNSSYNLVNQFLNAFNTICDLQLQINLKTDSISQEELKNFNFDLLHINFEYHPDNELCLDKISKNCKLVDIIINNLVLHKIHQQHKPVENYYQSLVKKYKIPIRVQEDDSINNFIYTP